MANPKNEKNKTEKPAKTADTKEVQKTEIIQKECCDKPDVSEKSNHGAWIMAIVFGALILVALSYGYNNVLQKNMLKKSCAELSNSPDFKYPTVCVPFDDDSNNGDYIDSRSEPQCRCKVDLGNGSSTVIDIRQAK